MIFNYFFSLTIAFTIMNITRAIIMKSIRFPVKSPTRNLMFPNDSVAALQSPPGITAPIIGIIRSVTSAVTSFVIAAPNERHRKAYYPIFGQEIIEFLDERFLNFCHKYPPIFNQIYYYLNVSFSLLHFKNNNIFKIRVNNLNPIFP